jgi:hypothetical protein
MRWLLRACLVPSVVNFSCPKCLLSTCLVPSVVRWLLRTCLVPSVAVVGRVFVCVLLRVGWVGLGVGVGVGVL